MRKPASTKCLLIYLCTLSSFAAGILPYSLSQAQQKDVIPKNGVEIEGGQACSTNADLVASILPDLDTVIPCDTLGALFLIGKGVPMEKFSHIPNPETFQFYFFVRSYLISPNSRPEDRFASLVIASTLMDSAPDEIARSSSRYKAYRAFYLLEYWEKLYAKDKAEGVQILNEDFLYSLQRIILGSDFTNVNEVHCFVVNDIPDISEDIVLESPGYRKCLGSQND